MLRTGRGMGSDGTTVSVLVCTVASFGVILAFVGLFDVSLNCLTTEGLGVAWRHSGGQYPRGAAVGAG